MKLVLLFAVYFVACAAGESCGGWFQKPCPTEAPAQPAKPGLLSAEIAPACGGWFQSACPEAVAITTTPPPPTPPAPSTTAEPCGGWFQKACPVTTTTTTTTTTPPPTTVAPKTVPTTLATPQPLSAAVEPCGGWFQKACPVTTTTTTTTPPPTTAAPKTVATTVATPLSLSATVEPCGGWFQKACPPTTTTAAPLPTVSALSAPACGGWFQSACPPSTIATPLAQTTVKCGLLSRCKDEPTTVPTTPAPCGGWFQSACPETTVATTAAPKTGLISGMVSSFVSLGGKAVNTALDLTSKVATVSLNNGVDFLLYQIKLAIRVTNMDEVSLPDINVDIGMGTHFNATGGYFKSLLSISRGGDITVKRDGLGFIVSFPVELKHLEVGFKRYIISTMLLNNEGLIRVLVKNNLIKITIRLALSISCSINVVGVELLEMDAVDIHMTNSCSTCGYLTSAASSYVAKLLQSTIKSQVEGQINGVLKSTLGNSTLICSKFLGA